MARLSYVFYCIAGWIDSEVRERERERERDLFYDSTARLWAYGGRLGGNMSLRLQSVYLSACDGLSSYGSNGNVHELITQCV